MKRQATLALLCIALLAMGLAGCDYVTGMKPAAATANATRYLTDQQLLQWREGSLNVTTQQRASALVGFDVKTPDYLPPGFVRSGVYRLENDIPLLEKIGRGTEPDMLNVMQVWEVPGKFQIVVLFQYNKLFGRGGLIPTTMDGTPVTKDVSNLGVGANLTRVAYTWQQDGTTLQLSGILGGGASETEYERVVRSIIGQP